MSSLRNDFIEALVSFEQQASNIILEHKNYENCCSRETFDEIRNDHCSNGISWGKRHQFNRPCHNHCSKKFEVHPEPGCEIKGLQNIFKFIKALYLSFSASNRVFSDPFAAFDIIKILTAATMTAAMSIAQIAKNEKKKKCTMT